MKILLINLITTVRFVGVFLLIPIYNKYGAISTAVVASVCFFTDFLDGYLARLLKSSTFFGSIYDSVVDKLFNMINFILIFTITKLAIIPLVFEALILLLNSVRFKLNQNIKTQEIGRIKTVVLAFSVIIFYILIGKYNIEVDKTFLILFAPLMLYQVITFNTYLIGLVKGPKEILKEKTTSVGLKNKLFSIDYYEENKDKEYYELLKEDSNG